MTIQSAGSSIPSLGSAISGAGFSGVQNIPVSGASVAGLAQSVVDGPRQISPAAFGIGSQTAQIPTTVSGSTDLRVRLSALDATLFTNSPIMSILSSTNGMLFPYSPSITLNQTVDYLDIPLVHSNTNYQAYTRTPSVKISVSGKFTVQNQREGLYALAAVHFLRTASKSHFGENDPQAGLPPPVLLFSGYGNYMFGKSGPTTGLRVILTSHSWAYDENIDTIPIAINNGLVRLPSLFTIQCELTVIQTPTRMRQVFTFQDFASGKLMQNSDGWI
jgi:hypothetical protein